MIDTIKSVDMQVYQDYEHIIIDGSTQPDINEYLKLSNSNPRRTWLSERDNGIADAFNKGINLSKGDFIVLLNSGDTFYSPDTLSIVCRCFESNPTIKWLHGKYVYQRAGQNIVIGKKFEKNLLYRGMRRVCHQTMYVSKDLYRKYGLYKESESIAMDYDFLCRISSEPFYFCEEVLAVFAVGGVSATNYSKALKDARRVYLQYFPYTIKLDLWRYRQLFLYNLLQTGLGKILFKLKTFLKLENW